jgi:hypothetical protein
MRRFKVGDTVIFDPGPKRGYLAPESVYEVAGLVPREDNVSEYAYRIKSVKEAMVRVARESQLTPMTEQ